MSHRVLLIEQKNARGDLLVDLIAPRGDLQCDRITWGSRIADDLTRLAPHLVIAVAVPMDAGVTRLFEWLGDNAVRAPVLAIVPETAEPVELRPVLEVVDDFAFYPVHCAEMRHRVARLLAVGRNPAEARIASWCTRWGSRSWSAGIPRSPT